MTSGHGRANRLDNSEVSIPTKWMTALIACRPLEGWSVLAWLIMMEDFGLADGLAEKETSGRGERRTCTREDKGNGRGKG